MTLNEFIEDALGQEQEFLMDAVDDLTPQELAWRAAPEANPIIWILWHMLRVEDMWIQFFILSQLEIWERDGWHHKFGLPTRDNGFDHTPEQVSSFPNLDLPDAFLPLLVEAGFGVDSSEGSHRLDHRVRRLTRTRRETTGLLRLPASTTSSVLRLPPGLRDPWLARLERPVVLLFHPWELVDLRGERRLRWDCRAGTGPRALAAVREVIHLFRGCGARFGTVADWAAAQTAA